MTSLRALKRIDNCARNHTKNYTLPATSKQFRFKFFSPFFLLFCCDRFLHCSMRKRRKTDPERIRRIDKLEIIFCLFVLTCVSVCLDLREPIKFNTLVNEEINRHVCWMKVSTAGHKGCNSCQTVKWTMDLALNW